MEKKSTVKQVFYEFIGEKRSDANPGKNEVFLSPKKLAFLLSFFKSRSFPTFSPALRHSKTTNFRHDRHDVKQLSNLRHNSTSYRNDYSRFGSQVRSIVSACLFSVCYCFAFGLLCWWHRKSNYSEWTTVRNDYKNSFKSVNF